MRKRQFSVLAPGVLLLTMCFISPSSTKAAVSWEGTTDVHYVRTPHAVVSEILRLADVGPSDIVYDLGCGDGRIVITAAREAGARGVGIDIDPLRVEESHRNAMRAGVSELVRFKQEDLFTADFSEATVVTLYLLPELNLRLRPELFRQLSPGTRVVSHKWHMGEWTPDDESSIGRSTIYYWVVPANASGRWEWSNPGAQGEEKYQLQMVQEFQHVDGILGGGSGLQKSRRSALTGDRLVLVFDRGINAGGGPIVLEGRIRGDVIEGTMTVSDGEPKRWRAAREPGTMSALEVEIREE